MGKIILTGPAPTKKKTENPPIFRLSLYIAEIVIATITDAVNTPDISAAEIISHLFDAIKRFIYISCVYVLHKNKRMDLCGLTFKLNA